MDNRLRNPWQITIIELWDYETYIETIIKQDWSDTEKNAQDRVLLYFLDTFEKIPQSWKNGDIYKSRRWQLTDEHKTCVVRLILLTNNMVLWEQTVWRPTFSALNSKSPETEKLQSKNHNEGHDRNHEKR